MFCDAVGCKKSVLPLSVLPQPLAYKYCGVLTVLPYYTSGDDTKHHFRIPVLGNCTKVNNMPEKLRKQKHVSQKSILQNVNSIKGWGDGSVANEGLDPIPTASVESCVVAVYFHC